MEKYFKKIIQDNANLFEKCKIEKINVGFTNLIYSASDNYIIKIFNNKNNVELLNFAFLRTKICRYLFNNVELISQKLIEKI